MVRRGHKVTVVGFSNSIPTRIAEHTDEGVTIIRVRDRRVPRLGVISSHARVERTLRQINDCSPIDVLEGPELCLAFLPAQLGAAKVIRMHGGHYFFSYELGQKRKMVRSWMERRSFRNADHLCAVSQHVANVTSDLLSLGERAIEILPNPVDTDRFAPQPNVKEVPFRIMFVGTVCEKKGVRQLIQALRAIVAIEPRAHLQVVGRDWHHPSTGSSYTAEMQRLAAELVPGRVTFLGTIDNNAIPALLATASVCVMPSHSEAMGIAWLEALSVGRPLIASRAGPGPEVVEDGVSGLLCNPHDPQSIASSVTNLLSKPALRDRLARAARQRAVDLFSTEALVIQNETFYTRCIKGNRASVN
jgi:glycosyltransferase involved in cell wall biosynthesis